MLHTCGSKQRMRGYAEFEYRERENTDVRGEAEIAPL
jgi:hypothetical protein